jgi:serine protease AprX
MSARRLLVSLAACLAVLAAALPAAGTADPGAALHHGVVVFNEAIPADFAASLRKAGVVDAVVYDNLRSVTVTAPVALLRRWEADPRVADVYDQRKLSMNLYASLEQIGAATAALPGDYTVGEDTFTRPGVTGAGQTVAILDTGVWSGHPDLAGRVTKELNFEFQYSYAKQVSPTKRDLIYESTGASSNVDDWGHGTHVAGIVGGAGIASAGRANHGVAPGADLVSLKMADLHNGLPDDAGWESNAIAALDWVLRHHNDAEFGPNGIRVVNNSWGLTGTDTIFGEPTYDPLAEVIDQLVERGVVMVFAAGNDHPSKGVGAVPNGMDSVVTVAAACKAVHSCRKGQIASFSSRGAAVDVSAPGTDIVSTVLPPSLTGALGQLGGNYGATTTDQAQNRAFYGSASGTSMAAPHIAGVVALLLEVNPSLTPAQVHDILTTTADDMLAPGHDIDSGHGLVNVPRALQAAHQLTQAPTE